MESLSHSPGAPAAAGKVFLLPALVVCGLSLASHGYAQQLEEVVVTAQKRSESLQDVPISVEVVSGDKMDDMGVMRLDQLTMYTPGLNVTEGAADAFIFIRGIGSGLNKGFEQSVGTYIDGLYYGRGRSSRNGMMDMERAEVLKGPQGILFGKNTIAGAINLTTRGPTPEPEGYVKIGQALHGTNETNVEGAYGGYITDSFGVRLATRYTSYNEWMDNTFNHQDIGSAHTESVTRLTLAWDPLDTLSMVGKFQYGYLEENEKPSVLVKCSPAMWAIVDGLDDCHFDDDTTVSARDPEGGWGNTRMDSMSAGLTVNWDMTDSLTLTSVSGFIKHIEDLFLDSDYSPAEILDSKRDENYQAASQELRIASDTGGKFEYMAGVYASHEKLVFDAGLNYNSLFTRVTHADQKTDSTAVFGQVTWNVMDNLALTGGLRYSRDQKEVNHLTRCALYKTGIPNGASACFGPTFVIDKKIDDDNVSPSVSAEWFATSDIMLYAKFSRGYKSGGFDLQTLSGDGPGYVFDSEKAKAYEIGAKTTLLDGGMTLNVALFRSEYDNLQVSTFDGNVGFNVGNAAEAISQGLDVELNWAATETITTALSLSLLDAYYDKFKDAQCSYPQVLQWTGEGACVADMSNQELQYSPDWSGHWNVTWEGEIASDLLMSVSGDVSFSSDFFGMSDNDPELRQGSFAKIDTRIAIFPYDEQWEVALLVKNLTDRRTFHYGNDVPLFAGSYFKNREAGITPSLQLKYRF